MELWRKTQQKPKSKERIAWGKAGQGGEVAPAAVAVAADAPGKHALGRTQRCRHAMKASKNSQVLHGPQNCFLRGIRIVHREQQAAGCGCRHDRKLCRGSGAYEWLSTTPGFNEGARLEKAGSLSEQSQGARCQALFLQPVNTYKAHLQDDPRCKAKGVFFLASARHVEGQFHVATQDLLMAKAFGVVRSHSAGPTIPCKHGQHHGGLPAADPALRPLLRAPQLDAVSC